MWPLLGDGRNGRCNRYLGEPAGDEGGKDHAERRSVAVKGPTGEHEPEATAPGGLHAGRYAGIGRLEGEVMGTLDLLSVETSSQDLEIMCVTDDAPSDLPQDVRG